MAPRKKAAPKKATSFGDEYKIIESKGECSLCHRKGDIFLTRSFEWVCPESAAAFCITRRMDYLGIEVKPTKTKKETA